MVFSSSTRILCFNFNQCTEVYATVNTNIEINTFCSPRMRAIGISKFDMKIDHGENLILEGKQTSLIKDLYLTDCS